MIPSAFEYHRPASLAEATQLLASSEDAKILSGGHSLLPMMKLRLANPSVVIDIGRLDELRGIQEAGAAIIIGANVTHYEAETSAVLQQQCPILSETAAAIGDVQVRNAGTIGGSVAHADPSADWPAAMLAVNAEITLSKAGGTRTVSATDFFIDLLMTVMEEDEILTSIRVNANPPRTGGTYLKVPQPASGFALAGVAAQVTLGSDHTIQQVAVGITGVDNKAFRASATETALQGQAATEAAISQAAAQATDGADALEDIHASAEYRLHLARVYTKRALLQAVERAQNG
ncbi:FAD binding domain-containing protein [Candidatus Entotheonella palauensis]|uniref:FAD binding domain-containing protein n=1 Tax=Candidatus Entotheonella palauensis TaxID=93172 RepID=UPI000B7FAC5B|nr:xanthine dehydrogenase family protein subunit M [Candidatus Entotheonella palauensis]